MLFDLERVNDLLVCPACHSPMVKDADRLVDVTPACRRAYPILDGIPRLLVVESEELSKESWGEIMERHHRDETTGVLTNATETAGE